EGPHGGLSPCDPSLRVTPETAQPPDALVATPEQNWKGDSILPSHPRGPSPSPAFLLEAYQQREPSLLLIAGPSGTGKTSWCAAATRLARAHALPVSGLLSPAVMDGLHKRAIDLLDLNTGERRRLAQRCGEEPAAG